MWAINNHKQGGVTGFQAGAIMWENISNWDSSYKGKPLKLMDFSNMLYPQYDHQFAKEISVDTWKYLQKEAKKKLVESPTASDKVIAHWKSIGDGVVPFGYIVVRD